jgi:hypothetical protein
MTAQPDVRARLTLRLPPALHARLTALAALNQRSLNLQILLLLVEAAPPEKEPTK